MSDGQLLALLIGVIGIVVAILSVNEALIRKILRNSLLPVGRVLDRIPAFYSQPLHMHHRAPPKLSADCWNAVARGLAMHYGVEPFERNGNAYPVFVVWAPPGGCEVRSFARKQVSIDPRLNEPSASIDRGLVRKLLETKFKGGGVSTEHVDFVLDRIHLDGDRLHVDVRLGWYYDNFIDSDGLARELFAHLTRGCAHELPSRLATLSAALPRRRQFDGLAPELLSGSGRTAAFGVSTVIIAPRPLGIKNSDSDSPVVAPHVLWGTRSHDVASWPGCSHVAPAFMWDATRRSIETESDLQHVVFREILEEVFGKEDERDRPLVEDPQAVKQDERIVRLEQLLDEGHAEMRVTGVLIDLLTRRPEICIALAIDDRDFFDDHPHHADPEHFHKTWRSLARVRSSLNREAQPGSFVPVGLVALELGLAWWHQRDEFA